MSSKQAELDIPEDIYEAANAFQKTGDESFTDNQRLAAMAGFAGGAMWERSRQEQAKRERYAEEEKKLSDIEERLMRLERIIDQLTLMVNAPKRGIYAPAP